MKRNSEKRGDKYPRAPSQAEWDALTPEEQARVVASLPDWVTDAELSPPEGDQHFLPKVRALDTLKGHFGREGRRVYLASELPVYYPDERRFAPDLLVVLDAEPHERGKWMVSAEGKGLDFILEVHVGGPRKKDAELNVARYSRLGIPEYFIYDGGKQRLWGYRLAAPEAREYVPIQSVDGRFPSERLGLDLQVEDGRLRFYENNVQLPESAELIDQLRKLADGLKRRASNRARSLKKEARLREETEQRLAQEKRLREEEKRLREDVQQQLRKAQAELTRLKGERA
ncbi:Uma2 family endonuclease [Pyxidicoccus sp. 3LFB2]